VLEVRGRKTGEPRRTPVNLLTLEGTRYLVAPRGHTHWVRNLHAQGEGRLLRGRRAEHFSASELADDDKLTILCAYLKRWKWEVGKFFDGVGPDSARRRAPPHRARPSDLPPQPDGALTADPVPVHALAAAPWRGFPDLLQVPWVAEPGASRGHQS
jgi:deazaflavin-dependent oxidoreductase (nitroreductase family)